MTVKLGRARRQRPPVESGGASRAPFPASTRNGGRAIEAGWRDRACQRVGIAPARSAALATARAGRWSGDCRASRASSDSQRTVRPGHLVILCALALLCLGVVMVQSTGLTIGSGEAISFSSIALSRPAAYMALALAAMFIASWAPVRQFVESRRLALSPAWIIPIALVMCALVYAPGLSREVNGAKRWIGLNAPGFGSLSMQPSEIAKWGSILFVAWYVVWRGPEIRRFFGGLVVGLAPVALIAGLVLLEDLGTAALIGAVAVILLLAGGARWPHVLALAPIGGVVLAVGILAEPYRMRRLAAFVDPFADPAGSGYHAIQSMAAVAGGGGFGRGLGFGVQKFGYLPEDQTDFIFAIICEELGLVGATLVLALYIGLLWSGWSIVIRERSAAMQLVGLGVLTTVGLQAIINLAAVTGLGPTKGIALPLVSSGGTGWMLTAASLGILVGMDRRQAMREGNERRLRTIADEPTGALPTDELCEPA